MSGEDKKSAPEEKSAPKEAEPQDDAADRVASDLEDGVESLGRDFEGAMTRLFGERITGQKIDPEKPVLGEDTDKALGQVSQSLGRLLNAAGKSMQDNPTRPGNEHPPTPRTMPGVDRESGLHPRRTAHRPAALPLRDCRAEILGMSTSDTGNTRRKRRLSCISDIRGTPPRALAFDHSTKKHVNYRELKKIPNDYR